MKRKNSSRSPSRSVGRSEVSEELFTSEEDEDLSSVISIDDVSSEQDTSEDIEDSFHSEIIENTTLTDADADIEELSEVCSIDSQLSWFQEHYYFETNELR